MVLVTKYLQLSGVPMVLSLSVNIIMIICWHIVLLFFCSLFQILVICSGVVAFSVNLSIFWIIGKTSPVTYPLLCVVGVLEKFALVLSYIGLLHKPPLNFNWSLMFKFLVQIALSSLGEWVLILCVLQVAPIEVEWWFV